VKRHRHTPEQIVASSVKRPPAQRGHGHRPGAPSPRDRREHLDRWRAPYGGMKADEAKRLRQLETENPRLKNCWPKPSWTRPCSTSWPRETSNPGAPPSGRRGLGGSLRGLRTPRMCSHPPGARPSDWPAGRSRTKKAKPHRRLCGIAREHPGWGWKTAHSILRRDGLGHQPQAHTAPLALRGPAPARSLQAQAPPARGRRRPVPCRAAQPCLGPRLPVRRDRRSPKAEAAERRRRVHP
jgi:putative transposase